MLVNEDPFEIALDDGVLHGHRAGDGARALVLHGGAAVTDYMDGCVNELSGLCRSFRYQQHGTFPSEIGPPLIPGARLELIPGSGHFPWLERPGELRRRVEPFLSGHC